jgi:hypothetical protein
VNLGAEPKKVAILAGLVVVGLGVYYLNSSGDSTPTPGTRTIAPVATGGEFRLRVLGTRPDDNVDPKDIDPELKLDLLAKIQAVEPIEAGRNLFQYGAAPPPRDRRSPSLATCHRYISDQPLHHRRRRR